MLADDDATAPTESVSNFDPWDASDGCPRLVAGYRPAEGGVAWFALPVNGLTPTQGVNLALELLRHYRGEELVVAIARSLDVAPDNVPD